MKKFSYLKEDEEFVLFINIHFHQVWTEYTSLNHGCTKLRLKFNKGKEDLIEYLKEKRSFVKDKIKSRGFSTANDLDISEDYYEEGYIFYITWVSH